jgi:alpha-D-ribose 1-methylphosphonate 5-triphosphate diphosphatase PhnM
MPMVLHLLVAGVEEVLVVDHFTHHLLLQLVLLLAVSGMKLPLAFYMFTSTPAKILIG